MITRESSLINSLVLAMQSAQGYKTDPRQKLAHWYQSYTYQASAHGSSSTNSQISHNSFPPGKSFWPHKLNWGYCSSGIWLAWMSSWSAFWLLKYDVGIHSASSTGYPCHRSKNLHHRRRVLELYRHRRIFLMSKYWGWSASSSSTSPRTCCTRLDCHCLSNNMWNAGCILHVSESFNRYACIPIFSRIL